MTGSPHPLRIRLYSLPGCGYKCPHFVECVAAIPPASSSGGTLPWEPFRPWSLMSTEGICLGSPAPGSARWKVLDSVVGMRARGSGVGPPGSREKTVAGKEAHWILQSDRSAWKAFLASVECRAAGSLPGMAVGERPNGPHQRPIPTFRHFREKLMTASVPWTSLLSPSLTAPAPPDCPGRLQWPEEVQAAWPPCRLCGWRCWVLPQLFTW